MGTPSPPTLQFSPYSSFNFQIFQARKKASFHTCIPMAAVCSTMWSCRGEFVELLTHYPSPGKHAFPTRVCLLLFTLPYFQVITFCPMFRLCSCFLQWEVDRLSSMALAHHDLNTGRAHEELFLDMMSDENQFNWIANCSSTCIE